MKINSQLLSAILLLSALFCPGKAWGQEEPGRAVSRLGAGIALSTQLSIFRVQQTNQQFPADYYSLRKSMPFVGIGFRAEYLLTPRATLLTGIDFSNSSYKLTQNRFSQDNVSGYSTLQPIVSSTEIPLMLAFHPFNSENSSNYGFIAGGGIGINSYSGLKGSAGFEGSASDTLFTAITYSYDKAKPTPFGLIGVSASFWKNNRNLSARLIYRHDFSGLPLAKVTNTVNGVPYASVFEGEMSSLKFELSMLLHTKSRKKQSTTL